MLDADVLQRRHVRADQCEVPETVILLEAHVGHNQVVDAISLPRLTGPSSIGLGICDLEHGADVDDFVVANRDVGNLASGTPITLILRREKDRKARLTEAAP